MTRKDEEKLKAAYGCAGCGGSHLGEIGEINFGNHDTNCEWLITVDDGSLIELSIKEYSVRLTFLKSDIHLQGGGRCQTSILGAILPTPFCLGS